MSARSTELRFFAKVEQDGDCWRWTGDLAHNGYGKASLDGRRVRAHRWAYEFMVGPIPEGLVLDHLCRNRWCVNPEHLDPVTRRVNVLRGDTVAAANARKTHCPRGHPLSGDNLIESPRHRKCRTCENAWHRARRANPTKEAA